MGREHEREVTMHIELISRSTARDAPSPCRPCGAHPARIVYGLDNWPTPEDAVFGGLAVDAADPEYFCQRCRRYCAEDGGAYFGGADPLVLGHS
jgi:hypothetical protein